LASNINMTIKRYNGSDSDSLFPTPAAHAASHQPTGTDPITVYAGNLDSGAVKLTFTGKTASTWTADGTDVFPYRCAIACSGVTSSFGVNVFFAQTEAESGNYSAYCATYDGGVYIYSTVNNSITVPLIYCWR